MLVTVLLLFLQLLLTAVSGLELICDRETQSFCANFYPDDPIDYDYFRLHSRSGDSTDLHRDTLWLNFQFKPSCADPGSMRLLQAPFIGGPAKEYSIPNGTLTYDQSQQYFVIKNASFANAGNYSAYCMSNVPVTHYRDGKMYPVFIRVKPRILYADVVNYSIETWKFDHHFDMRQLLGGFLKPDVIVDDPRILKDYFGTNLTSFTELFALNLNGDTALISAEPHPIRARFEANETTKYLRFHVGNGFYDNTKAVIFRANESMLSKLVPTKGENCQCNPQDPQLTSFSVRNFPNGTTFWYELPLAKAVSKEPNNCSFEIQTSASIFEWKDDQQGNFRHNFSFNLQFEYRPQNLTIHLTNFDNGTCLVECLFNSSCPNTFSEAKIVVIGGSSRDSKNDQPFSRSYEILSPNNPTKGHLFDPPLCSDFNHHGRGVELRCVLLNTAGLKSENSSLPGDDRMTISGKFVAKNWPQLEWWAVLLIVLTCLFFVIILVGLICFIGYVENMKRKQAGGENYHSRTNFSARDGPPVFATIGSNNRNNCADNNAGTRNSNNNNKQQQLRREHSSRSPSIEPVCYTMYDNEGYSTTHTRMTTPSPNRLNRIEAVV